MGYKRLGKWIDWQSMKHGVPLAIVNSNGTSSECPKYDSKLEENGYRRLRCPRCSFEADRDVIGKLNIRKRALKILGISGESLATPTAPQMTDVNPNRWGESMNSPEGNPRPLGRGGGQHLDILLRYLVRVPANSKDLHSPSFNFNFS